MSGMFSISVASVIWKLLWNACYEVDGWPEGINEIIVSYEFGL